MSNAIYRKISTISPATEFRDQTRLLGFNNDSTTNVFPSNTLTSYMRDKLGINNITSDISNAKNAIKELKPTVIQHTTRIDEISEDIQTLSGNVKTLSTSIQTETESRETKDNEITTRINNLENTLTNQITVIKTTPATANAFGMIKLGFTVDQSSKKYPVQLQNNQAFVQVPWYAGEIDENQIREIVENYLTDDNIYNAITSNRTNITNISNDIWKEADPEDPESEDGILARLDSIEDVVDYIGYFDDDNDLISGLIYDTNISVGNLCIEIENLSATVSNTFIPASNIVTGIGEADDKVASQSLVNNLSATVSNTFIPASNIVTGIGEADDKVASQSLVNNLSATVSSDYVKKEDLDKYYVKKEGLDKLIADKINEILSQSSMT